MQAPPPRFNYTASPANKQRFQFRSAFGFGGLLVFSLVEYFNQKSIPAADTMQSVVAWSGISLSSLYLALNAALGYTTVSKMSKELDEVKIQTFNLLGRPRRRVETFAVSDLEFYRRGQKNDYFFARVKNRRRVFRFDYNKDTREVQSLFKFPALFDQNEGKQAKSKEEIFEDRFFERRYNKKQAGGAGGKRS